MEPASTRIRARGRRTDGTDGGRELLFADQGNRIHGNALAPDVVPVGLRDGPHGDEPHLGAAPHDDDPLTVDSCEGRRLDDRGHAGHFLQIAEHVVQGDALQGQFEVDLRARLGMDVHVGDVGAMIGQDLGQPVQHARPIGDGGENGMGGRGH